MKADSGIPEKTESMRQTTFWIVILLATLFSACSGQKKVVKSGNPEETAAAAIAASDEKKARFEELFTAFKAEDGWQSPESRSLSQYLSGDGSAFISCHV